MLTIALSDKYGELISEPSVEPLAKSGVDTIILKEEDVIPLPEGSSIMMLPARAAAGRFVKKGSKKQVVIGDIEGEKVYPAAAVLPPGYTRTYLPAYERDKKACTLPFFAYTAIGVSNGEILCAAIETHKDLRWDPAMYNSLELPTKIKLKKKSYPKNRLLKHLEKCAVEYKCFTAQNIFYERWEGGIPTAAACNAQCGGCISKSAVKGTPSPQNRINFVPTVEEIVELAVSHLKTEGGIISFGQGCEGEPLTRGDLIIEATKKIREETDKGTININTNGSLTKTLEGLIDAGLDSARISLNSAIEQRYTKYFRPQQFTFYDVVKSIDLCMSKGIFTSLNFLYLPGVNDREEEADAFFEFLEKHPVNMIQIRNLNIDPDYYFSFMDSPKGKAVGTAAFIEKLKTTFPDIEIGNFSIPHPASIEEKTTGDEMSDI